MEKLHVITCISNPVRYKSRYRLYKEFEKRMQAHPHVVLHTAEIAFGNRPHEVTEPNNPFHLQLRSKEEIWHKENMLNLLLRRLPADWKYVAWIDADVTFVRPDWVEETIQQLQHYHVVQLFSRCQDLNDHFEPVGRVQESMFYAWHNGGPKEPTKPYGSLAGHCGYAWAATRHAIETLGGFIDYSILGSADHQMATALLGDVTWAMGGGHGYHPDYLKKLREWEAKAAKLRKNVGYVEGMLLHHWHGPKINRGYNTRWRILWDHQYNPYTDLETDWQGLIQFVDDGSERYIQLRDKVRDYFRSRDEDVPHIPE